MFSKIFFVVFVYKVNAIVRRDLDKYGAFQMAVNSNLIKCDHDKNLNLIVSGTNIHFYDFNNHDEFVFPIERAGKEIPNLPKLNKNRKFILFVAGYKSNINKTALQEVRETFEKVPEHYLMIADHSSYTDDDHGIVKSYERAVQHVYYIGKALADMLATITQNGVSPKNIHCIGHSLGAQILGHTGDIFIKQTGQKLAKITGLDPAGPCFSKSPVEEQLRSGVADYVEVYHCNAGALGTTSVLGDVDFFVNKKGSSQPDCGTFLLPGLLDPGKAAKCNHRACVELYLATVIHHDWFPAKVCDSYKQYKKGDCSENAETVAGFWGPGTARGVYYLSTKHYDV